LKGSGVALLCCMSHTPWPRFGSDAPGPGPRRHAVSKPTGGESDMWKSERSEFAPVQWLFVRYPQTVVMTCLSHAGFVPVEQ
jgi:hypothetical protein